jgi:hypothetical protein
MAVSSATAGSGNVNATTSGAAETLFDADAEGTKCTAIRVYNRSGNTLNVNVNPIHASGDFIPLQANTSLEFRYDGGGSSGPRGQINTVTVYGSADPTAIAWAITEQ